MTEQLSLFPEFSNAPRCVGCKSVVGDSEVLCCGAGACQTGWFALLEKNRAVRESERIWEREREDIIDRFSWELTKVTRDGSKKRQSGSKPPWHKDNQHEGAIFSHLTKWKRGELVDPDSGAHPLVHLAWRALAIACKESGNVPKADA